MKHHPLKNPAEMKINLQKFHEICEAYEVLSNCKPSFVHYSLQCNTKLSTTSLEKKCCARESKMKLAVIITLRFNSFVAYKGGYVYQQNCYEIFDTYFLKYNPFFDIYDGKGSDLHGSLFGTGYGGANQPQDPRLGDVFVQIPCTLLEFYNGSIKTVKYMRQELSLDGYSVKTVSVAKTVAVKPGYSQNNALTFKGEGHLMKGYHSDLVVSFVESNHSLKLT